MRWIRDVFGNTVGIVKFARPSDTLVFDSKVKVDHRPMRGLHLSPEDYAYLHPFAYDEEEMPDLHVRSIAPSTIPSARSNCGRGNSCAATGRR